MPYKSDAAVCKHGQQWNRGCFELWLYPNGQWCDAHCALYFMMLCCALCFVFDTGMLRGVLCSWCWFVAHCVLYWWWYFVAHCALYLMLICFEWCKVWCDAALDDDLFLTLFCKWSVCAVMLLMLYCCCCCCWWCCTAVDTIMLNLCWWCAAAGALIRAQ